MRGLSLPNRKLVQSLYEDYYAKENLSQNKFVSSHWEYFSKKFDIQVDGEGNIHSLLGMGLGQDVQTRNPLEKLLNYLCHLSYLIRLPERLDILKLIPPSLNICKSMGFYFSFDCFRQVCTLALLMRYMSDDMKKKRLRFLMIGDGYGFLSSLIKSVVPNSTVVLVDIGKTLLFQSYYCQRAHPESIHSGMKENCDNESADFLYCPTEYLENLGRFQYDIVVNVVSMQEMNFETVERYFSFLRKNCHKENLFYCCNRELKVLPAGEALEFKKYPWKALDRYLVDEYCPWHKYLLSCHRYKKGPRVFGIRLPFINYFDGPIMHRLTVLSTENSS